MRDHLDVVARMWSEIREAGGQVEAFMGYRLTFKGGDGIERVEFVDLLPPESFEQRLRDVVRRHAAVTSST